MGRYVRSVLRGLAQEPDVTLTLLVRDPRRKTIYRELLGDIDVAPLAAAKSRDRFSCVWYPWNGMRFVSHAPSVVTINDDFAFAYPARERIARWREQRPVARATRRATHIATISEWSRTALVERFALDADRISVIPLEPDDLFLPGSDQSPYAEPFVLAVGTREERKNIAFLIDAFAQAFPANDVRLVLVGELDARLQTAVQQSAASITPCPGVDDRTLLRLYRTAAAVAVPSLAEGFGLVAAEAQACGAAVIAANATALPEAVGIAGMLVDPHDRRAWSRALRELVRNLTLNSYYRAQSLARWRPGSRERTTQAILATLQRAIRDRA